MEKQHDFLPDVKKEMIVKVYYLLLIKIFISQRVSGT